MTKLQLRRTWFQVHKWVGLILAILIIPLSLSGALLVWDGAVDRVLNPARYATTGTTLLPVDRYADAARAALPTPAPIASIRFPAGSDPVIVQASVPDAVQRPGPPARTLIWLDPPTARVLAVADSRSGALRLLHRLHGSLLVPGVGRTIVGWIGIAMMMSCFTGIWLWWPTVGTWTKGLRWRRHRNVDTNLHHLAGFWIAVPLFVLSLSGAWISFPGVFSGGRGDHGPPRARGGQPLATPALAPQVVLDQAHRASAQPIRTLDWPKAGKNPTWTIATAERSFAVDDHTDVMTAAPARPHGGTGIAGLMRRVHDGEGMGSVWRAIIFVGGILPALLAITGVIMWWRARHWRARRVANSR
jgi:uncharacterized iron-regulated membrane protein